MPSSHRKWILNMNSVASKYKWMRLPHCQKNHLSIYLSIIFFSFFAFSNIFLGDQWLFNAPNNNQPTSVLFYAYERILKPIISFSRRVACVYIIRTVLRPPQWVYFHSMRLLTSRERARTHTQFPINVMFISRATTHNRMAMTHVFHNTADNRSRFFSSSNIYIYIYPVFMLFSFSIWNSLLDSFYELCFYFLHFFPIQHFLSKSYACIHKIYVIRFVARCTW